MSKFFWLFLLLIIVGLILTGIVEINIKPQKYVDIPGVANSVLKEKTTFEKGRAFIVSLKRKGELFVVQDKEKRLVLSLLYVKTDAERLKELIEREIHAQALLPQAELLVSSIEQVRSNAEKAPVEVVAGMKDESAKSFAQAHEALAGLQEQYEEYEQIQEEFTRLTESLEQQIGQLGLEGSQDEETDEPEEATSEDEENNQSEDGESKIPLKF